MTTTLDAPRKLSSRSKEMILYAAVILLTIAATVATLKLWHLDLLVPMGYDGDATLISSHFKTILETGWYLQQPLLAAPDGQEYFDWKIADNLGMLFGLAMRPFTTNFGVVQNLYFLVGFPLAAVTATWFLRRIRVSRWVTAALAVLFALAPYHFFRGETHLWLASYFPIPLALGVVSSILVGRPVWTWRRGGVRVGGLRLPPALATVGILLLVSVSNSYYAFITLLLIAAAGVAAVCRTRSGRRFIGAVSAGLLVVAVLAASLLPSTIYGLVNGTNSSAVARLPSEAELYAFKFTQLILPAPWHRVPAFRALRSFYDSVYGNPAETPVLGLIASAGFLALLLSGLFLLSLFGRGRPSSNRGLASKLGALSFLTVVCFLLGTVGGLGTIISFLTSDLRGWNRISIFIAMLALAGFGLVADAAFERFRRRVAPRTAGGVRWIPAVGAILILFIGLWDQTGPLLIPNYPALSAAYQADEQLADEIEAATSPTAMILQLPFHPFPEYQSAQGVLDSNQLKPYLHSHTLRWSGGGVKGRPASEWVAAVERMPADDVITTAVAAGFAGIFIDTRDLTESGRALAAGIASRLGPPAVTSGDGRYLFYSLKSVSEAIRAESAESTLDRVGKIAVSPVLGQFYPRFDTYTGPQLLEPYNPRISLDNDRSETVEVQLRFTLAYTAGDATLAATLPDGTVATLSATPGGVPQELTFDVAPGVSDVTFSLREGPSGTRSLSTPGPIIASGVEVVDVELDGLLTELRPAG